MRHRDYGLVRLQLLAGSCAAGLLALPGVALAQDAQTTSPAAASAEEVELVVTGSRVQRDGYQQPTPVTVMTTEDLLESTPTSLADGLNRLPQFVFSRTRAFCCEVVSVGNYLNLRGLGSNRTLVLLDGDRVVATREAGDVDVNLLPEILIERIDVVTGGASAAYGSDAVSGVVNYIIDNDLEGFRANVQFGISGFGDDENFKAAVAGGSAFDDGRGHFVFSLEHNEIAGIPSLDDRPLSSQGAFMGGNGSVSAPYTALTGVRQNTSTYGGVIVNSANFPSANAGAPLGGRRFEPNGTTTPFTFGAAIPGSANFTIGGDGHLNNLADPLQSLQTDHAYVRVSYDVTDAVTAYLRVNAGRSRNVGDVLANSAQGTASLTIFRENAFLPAAVGTAMDGASVTSFRMARFNRDFGVIALDYSNDTIDVSVGLEGTLGETWSWDLSASHGETTLEGRAENVTNLANLYAATDAVIDGSTGLPVCRVTLTNPGVFPGCAPINLFGEGAPSQAALDFVTGTSTQVVRNEQTVVAFAARGDLLTLPAGVVSVALGAEHRERGLQEESNEVALGQIKNAGVRGMPTAFCPTVTTCRFGGWNQGNFGEANASDSVSEAFVEAVIPILTNSFVGRSLELNTAYRYTDYEFSGGTSTYKVGLSYEPVENLRFRAVRSQDIRAPNLFEMFAGPVNAFQAGLVDPFTATSNIIGITRTQGNPNLQPEEAETSTIGVVYSPSWLPGLTASIDYYDISIAGALSATTAQSTLDQCFTGDTEACSRITRDSGGNLQQIALVQINLDSRNVRGIDFDVSYSRPLGEGDLGLRAVFTRSIDYIDTVGGVSTQRAGGFANLLAIPEWRGNLSATYDVGDYTFSLQGRYIGGYEQLPPAPGQIFAEPSIDAKFYTDVSASYRLNEQIEIYGSVNDLFDVEPPFVPNRFAAGLAFPSSAMSLYDIDNRYFTIGARASF